MRKLSRESPYSNHDSLVGGVLIIKRNELMNEKFVNSESWMLVGSRSSKTQYMFNKAVKPASYIHEDVPDYPKAQDMCKKAVDGKPRMLEYVPDHLKTRDMCNKAVELQP